MKRKKKKKKKDEQIELNKYRKKTKIFLFKQIVKEESFRRRN